MGDHDYNREPRRKKFNKFNKNKEKEDSNLLTSNKKGLLILTKSHSEKNQQKVQPKIVEPPPPPPVQPTIILKSRDAASPNPRIKTKETDSPTSGSKASSTQDNLHSLLPSCPHMTTCHKLIDDSLLFNAGLQEYFSDQSDFFVIGVIGLQGCGKSTLLSNIISDTNSIFKVQSRDDILNSSHCTSGVDIYITSNRLILLDTQPILSPSLFYNNIKNGHLMPIYDPLTNKSALGASTEFGSMENSIEIHSLQLSTFIFSVCHVVLFVQDWMIDPNFIRFIQTTEMLKPSNLLNRSEEYSEYFPEGVFIHNKTKPSDFMKENVEQMQDFYSNSFSKSKLFISTGKNLSTEDLNKEATETSHCNIFLVPIIDEDISKERFHNHPEFREVIHNLRKKIMGSTRRNLTINTLSEKNWLLYAKKVWEYIRKNNYFIEYNRLMP